MARDKGQSMVLFLAFAAAMVGMLLVAFNSGQVTNAKMRAMNAADAAAFSGAQWQARNLNFQAYMNRAIVVNEVTIAQSVSVRSWVSYVKKFVENVSLIAWLYPPAGAAVNRVSQIVTQVDNQVQNILPNVEYAIRALANTEHMAQKSFNTAALIAAPDLAKGVAQANGAALSTGGVALVATSVNQWRTFTDTYAPGARNMGSRDRRVRLKEVILDSRDGFVQERDWKFGGKPVAELRKQGGTDLIDYDTWKGLDSLELREFYNYFRGRWSSRQAIGYGGAQAYAPQVQYGRGTHGGYNEWNNNDGRSAVSTSNKAKYAKRLGDRLSGYRDLTQAQLQARTTPKLPFAVEVVIGNVATSGGANMRAKAATLRGEALDMDPQYVNGDKGVYAIAEACIAFERPHGADRRDGLTEKPSLFNPYWRASMATPDRETRRNADLAKGLPPITSLFGGPGSCAT